MPRPLPSQKTRAQVARADNAMHDVLSSIKRMEAELSERVKRAGWLKESLAATPPQGVIHPDKLHDLKATITDILDLEKRDQICEPFDEGSPVLCPVCSAVWYRTGVEGHNHVCTREDFGPFARPHPM